MRWGNLKVGFRALALDFLGRATQLWAEARRLDKQAAPAGGYEHGHMHDTAAIFPSYSCAEKAKAQGLCRLPRRASVTRLCEVLPRATLSPHVCRAGPHPPADPYCPRLGIPRGTRRARPMLAPAWPQAVTYLGARFTYNDPFPVGDIEDVV